MPLARDILRSLLYASVVCVLFARSVAAEEGLVAHYPMNEGAGGTAHDESGNGNDGTIIGAQWATGTYGTALSFDGTDDYVDCGADESLRIESAGSIVCWFRPESDGGGIVNWSTGGNWCDERLVISYNNYGSSSYFGVFMANGTVHTTVYRGPYPPTGEWTHVAVTFDGITARVFLDGAVVTTVSQSVVPNLEGVPMWIAKSLGLGDYYFDGLIDDVRIYNRPISEEEVFLLYKASAAIRGKDTTWFDKVRVTARAYPEPAIIFADLDYHEMSPLPEGMTIEADLRDMNDDVVAAAAVEMLPNWGQAEVRFDVAALPQGNYEVRAQAKYPDGPPFGQEGRDGVAWPGQPEVFQRITILNNLCWELLNVSPGAGPDPAYDFPNPRRGWVYFITETEGDLTLSVGGASPGVIHDSADGDKQECMRWLPEGEHTVSVNGTGSLNKLIARRVPALVYCQYPSNPHVSEYGAYDRAFLDRHLSPQTNIIISNASADFTGEWVGQGKRWIQNIAKNNELTTVEEIHDDLTSREGLTNPQINGLIIDEFGHGSFEYLPEWTEACDQILSDPAYAGKMIIPYAGMLYMTPEGAAFTQMLVSHGSYISWKRYLPEQSDTATALAYIRQSLADNMSAWEAAAPGATSVLLVCLGYLCQPPESININPATNFSVFMDMEFHHLATRPEFFGVGGIQEYLSPYCDEENVRLQGKLFRHYALEGHTERFLDDPYELTHIENPDFEDGTAGWTVTEAEADSVRVDSYAGYSFLTGRYPRTSKGDIFLVMRRSAAGPNVFAQTISNLEPGRYYSMKMITGDYQDLVGGISDRKEHAISIAIDNVAMLRLPDKSFTHIYPQCYSHDLGPFNVSHRYYMNFHWRVFKALATTATLTVSDWSAPDDPGGDAGQEIMFNFIEIQPYLYEPEHALNVRSRPVTSVNVTAVPDYLSGETDYALTLLPDTEVSLTAPGTHDESGGESTFIRWDLVQKLAAHWPISAMSGTTVEDVSCHGNHGTIEGATWEETGWGNALSFDGVDDYVACETWNSLDITGAVTLGVWINPDQIPAGETWVAGKDFTRFLMTYYTDGRCCWYIRGGGNSCKTAVSVGQWSHVVGTFDGVTLRLYVNGQLMDEKVSTYSDIPTGMDFRIGGNESGACFAGKVGDVKVYARALSLTEVQNEYASGPETYAGNPQPDGQTTATFTINEATTAVAEYVRVKRTLQVQSTPVQGVDISGTFPGVTNYSVDVDDNSAVALTAPERAIVGDTSYEFVKWVLDAADQPEGQTSLTFVIQDATIAVAEYILYKPTLQVQSLPITDVTITGTHPGTTNYSEEADNNSQVTLTAPETVSKGDADYVFVRWRKTDNLVGYYPFDEAAGDTAFDAGGHKNHGTIIGAQWAAGCYGAALSFDGVDDFVDCRVRDSLRIESAGSILLWLNPTVCQGGLVNWSTGGGWPDERLVLTFKTHGTAEKLGVYMADGTSYAYAYEGPFPRVGEWMHFALTFDGSSVAVYRDGAQVYTGGQGVTPNLENVPMWIGKSLGLGHSFFNGLIDEVRIYNRVLSADEVEREYLNGPGTYAGDAQPDGDTTISFTITEPTIVVAEYALASLLQVRSTPIAGVQITGTCPGATTYTKLVADGADVTLTAPETFTDGSDEYRFVRWIINGADQPDGQATVTFNVNGDTTAEAVYTLKGDFDGDGDIDDLDFAAFKGVYGLSEGDPGWEPNGPIADFDDDADVDFSDFMEFVDVYGT